jgi:hypothetical protein
VLQAKRNLFRGQAASCLEFTKYGVIIVDQLEPHERCELVCIGLVQVVAPDNERNDPLDDVEMTHKELFGRLRFPAGAAAAEQSV